MSETELIEENKQLKEKVEELECLLKRRNNGNTRAYDEIRAMIISKVDKEVEVDIVNGQERSWTKKIVEKQIMSDLKWDLRIRRVSDFTIEHIEPAREYVKNYILNDDMKKSKWR